MNGVDLARFEFDYDTTWQAFFLDADLNSYSRYGGRDEASADGRHSPESLLTTMREVLEVHQRRREGGRSSPRAAEEREGADGGSGSSAAGRISGAREIDPDLQPLPGKSTTPEDIPLLRRNHQGCVHCHQVQEFRILQAFHDKSFSREQLFGFPLPENLGIGFDRRHGHKIEAVIPGSAAAAAGLLAGDVVTRVNDVPIHSEQDVRWALHRTAAGDKPMITVLRRTADSERTIRVQLAPPRHWRQTELSWRKSLRSVPLPVGCLAYPRGREERQKAGLRDDRLAIKVLSIRGSGLASSVGLLKGDLIVALDGKDSSRTFEEFKSDLLRRYSPGDVVRLTVLRDGKTLELAGPFPEWHTTATSAP